MRSRLAAVLLTAATAFAIGWPPAVAGVTDAPACDLSIDATVEAIDGTRTDVPPGTVICVAAGTRGNLKLANLHGTLEAPIVVRNEGGRVLLTGTRFEAAILLISVSNLHITGTGVEARCGAEFPVEEQRCGIEIDGATKGIKLATARGEGPSGEIEIDHVGIHRVSSEQETRGIAIHPVSGQTIAGIRIHHNLVSNTLAEGIYIGSEPRKTPYPELGKVDRVEIAYNRLDQIGFDGIKVKVAISGSSVHHNVVTDVGLARYEKHQSGITVAMSDIDVHHNTVIGAVEGIKGGRGREDAPDNAYYRNVVADVVLSGIDTTEAAAQITHNTVARGGQIGIRARGEAGVVTHNIITDAGRAVVIRKTATERDNLVTSTREAGFGDPDAGDFSLLETSPAVDAGSLATIEFCVQPGIRVLRPMRAALPASSDAGGAPSRCITDLGAVELVIAPSVAAGA